MSELRTLESLIEALSEHAERPAIVAVREEGAERWSYGITQTERRSDMPKCLHRLCRHAEADESGTSHISRA